MAYKDAAISTVYDLIAAFLYAILVKAAAYHVTLMPSDKLALELSGMPSLLCLPSM